MERKKDLIIAILFILFYMSIGCREEIQKDSPARESAVEIPPPRPTTIRAEITISRYDDLVKRYARRYGFDWRLISAQIFAESTFRPDAESHVGAVGLMQILPSTANWLGEDPRLLLEPETNISLGVYYDFWIYSRISRADSKEDKISFMLGSYNAGPARIKRIRKRVNNGAWSEVWDLVPVETRKYVMRIWKKYDEYCAIKS